jgi:ferredoxin-like protein FixX
MECQAIFVMHSMALKQPITEEVGSPKCPHGCGVMKVSTYEEPLELDYHYCLECGHVNVGGGGDCLKCSSKRKVC